MAQALHDSVASLGPLENSDVTPASRASPSSSSEDGAFTRRVAIAVGGVALAGAGVWIISRYPYVPLMVFAGALLAVLLDSLMRPLQRFARLPRSAALGGVVAALLGLVGSGLWAWGPFVVEQASRLLERVPDALNRLEGWVARSGVGGLFSGADGWDVQSVADLLTQGWSPLAGIFSTTFGAVSGVLVVFVVGAFLAHDPELYLRGASYLLPRRRRDGLRELLGALGRALRWWLVGRFSSMAVVGVLTGVGLWVLGLPFAPLLGTLAALLSFVPYLGPIVSVVPAVLVALAEGAAVFGVIVLYGAVQIVEGNLVTPLIQARTVSLPPALLIVAQLAMGALAGLLGLLLATPLAVALIVAVQRLYVQEILGEDIALMGEHGERGTGARSAPGSAAPAREESLADPEHS